MTQSSPFESNAMQITANEKRIEPQRATSNLSSFWFQEQKYLTPEAVSAETNKLGPLSHYDASDLTRIATYIASVKGTAAWEKIESEWFDAMGPQLDNAKPQEIGNSLRRLLALRPSKKDRQKMSQTTGIADTRDLPYAFKAYLWQAIDKKAPLFNGKDFAQLLSGLTHEGANPPSKTWQIINTYCASVLMDPAQKITRKELMRIYYGYSDLRQKMPVELKETFFQRALSTELDRHNYLNVAGWTARLSETIPPFYEKHFYRKIAENWNAYKPENKARIIWSIAVFSVLEPLSESARNFLSSVSMDDIRSVLDMESFSAFPAALSRLLPNLPKDIVSWERADIVRPIGGTLKSKLEAAGLPITARDGVTCAVQTKKGPVLVQEDFPAVFISDAMGKQSRRKGAIQLKTALCLERFPESVVRLSSLIENQMSPSDLEKVLSKAAQARHGAYDVTWAPEGFVLRDIDIQAPTAVAAHPENKRPIPGCKNNCAPS